uniref:5-hydroxytryptamine (serotonin) receptor 7c n=1 Tax=Sphaeramia orbicularis TaxID=375764 RepID=A0A672YMQ4_9TELE
QVASAAVGGTGKMPRGSLPLLYNGLVTSSPTTMWNESCGEQLLDFGRPEKIIIGVMLAIITAVTVMGNTQPSNYLLVSLAVADLSVAIVVMPFVIVTDLTGGNMDVMCCTASIMTLCVISYMIHIALCFTTDTITPAQYCVHLWSFIHIRDEPSGDYMTCFFFGAVLKVPI